MDLGDWQRLHERLDAAHRGYIGIRLNDEFGIRDLWTMHRAIYEKLREADREWVNCRRRGVGSTRYDQLLTEAEQALKNFEGHLLLAKLMTKEPE